MILNILRKYSQKNEELKFGNKNCEVRVNCTRNGRTRKRNLELISNVN